MFGGSFLPFWTRIRIANPDPNTDPGTPLNPDPVTDPDPQHWLFLYSAISAFCFLRFLRLIDGLFVIAYLSSCWLIDISRFQIVSSLFFQDRTPSWRVSRWTTTCESSLRAPATASTTTTMCTGIFPSINKSISLVREGFQICREKSQKVV